MPRIKPAVPVAERNQYCVKCKRKVVLGGVAMCRVVES